MTCLLLFICDEILSEFAQLKSVIFCSLTIFIAISYFYFLMLWYRFFAIVFFRKRTKEYSKNVEKRDLTKIISNKLKGGISCILIIIVFINFAILSTSNIFEMKYLKYCIVYLLGIFMPIFAICLVRIKSNNGLDERKYRFALKHFIYFMTISISCATIIALLNALSIDIPLLDINHHNLIKYSALFFILLNGIILPFLIPYYCLKRVGNHTIKEIENVKTKIDKDTNDAKNELDEFINSLNSI